MRAVVFDFDGVIADTERLHFETFARVLSEEGIEISTEDHGLRFLGINDRAGFLRAFEDAGRSLSPEGVKELVERKSVWYRKCIGRVQIFPGVRELVAELAERCPLAIASGGRGAEIDQVLRAHGIRSHFLAILSADEVARSKPAPDSFLRALDGLRAAAPALAAGLGPEDCLAIEDSLPGIRAAKAAGMSCLAVAHTYPAHLLSGADRVAERLGALSAEEVLGEARPGTGRDSA